jgi:hypothetical protein
MQEHDALERELAQLLALEESGGDGGGKWGDSKQRKARVRQIKNRLAAKKSREHARTYVQELEGTLESLQAKNEDLARRLQLALEQNEALMRKMNKTDNKSINEGNDRIGEPAALPINTSLQLDAVPLLMLYLSVFLCLHLPQPEAQAAVPVPPPTMERPSLCPPSTRRRASRSVRSLRRAGELLCFSESFRSRPLATSLVVA